MMYQHLGTSRAQGGSVGQDDRFLARHVYRCDADSAIVNTYKQEFEQIWNRAGQEAAPEKFLEKLKVLNPPVVSQVESELDSTEVVPH
jgi:hypothetical protein